MAPVGPGIWYAITIASPRGVGGLIHNFVWVWAAEWVYFTVEVIGVYALVYLIEKVDAKTHLKLTGSCALASWATMLLIAFRIVRAVPGSGAALENPAAATAGHLPGSEFPAGSGPTTTARLIAWRCGAATACVPTPSACIARIRHSQKTA